MNVIGGALVAVFLLGGIVLLGAELSRWRAPVRVAVQEDSAAPRRPRVRPIREDELPLATIPWNASRIGAKDLPARVPVATLPRIKQRFDPRKPERVNVPTAKLPWDNARETASSIPKP